MVGVVISDGDSGEWVVVVVGVGVGGGDGGGGVRGVGVCGCVGMGLSDWGEVVSMCVVLWVFSLVSFALASWVQPDRHVHITI